MEQLTVHHIISCNTQGPEIGYNAIEIEQYNLNHSSKPQKDVNQES